MEKSDRHLTASMNALMVLEAAVRFGNFSVAARHLEISQPAVSRHIAVLEERLGAALFYRNNNRIIATDTARRLASAVSTGFGHIGEAWTSALSSQPANEISLACTFGFSDQWLMPRFARLRHAMAGTRVRVITTDQVDEIDLQAVDAAVVCDADERPDRRCIPLIAEEVFPICSPSYARDILGIESAICDDVALLCKLAADHFLHFDQGTSGFLTWDTWFSKQGIAAPQFGKREMFTAYPFMIQAVLNGEGVALGWRGLVDELVREGKVVKIGPTVSNRETAYFLQHRVSGPHAASLDRLVQWFSSEVSEASS